MNLFLRLVFSVLLGLCIEILSTEIDRAQAAIIPTVVEAVGDRGGRFFGVVPPADHVRRYYIAAEEVQWDYAPLQKDVVCGQPLPLSLLDHRIAKKWRYVEYTDGTFKTPVATLPRLGLLGPVLRGVVGEYLVITFWNRSQQPLSMHPHGVRYDKDSEGAYYQPSPGLGAAVGPGAVFTYVWKIDADSGPLPTEPSSKAWLYHSHVTGEGEINDGLVGLIVVTDPKRARPDGTPRDVDREMAALFMIFDEGTARHREPERSEHSSSRRSESEDRANAEEGYRHALNGYVYGNLPGLEMNEGERVRWYLIGLGTEQDIHTAHWHGERVMEEGRRRTDVVELLPASVKVADFLADNPGRWLFHCHVGDHMSEGMYARFVIYPKSAPDAPKNPAQAFLGAGSPSRSLPIPPAGH